MKNAVKYLAVDAGMRYGTCIRLDGATSYTIYALAVVAVSEGGVVGVYTEGGATKMTRDEFVEYARTIELSMYETHPAEICIVDGAARPHCGKIVHVTKTPVEGSLVTPWGYVSGDIEINIRDVIALNHLAHRYASELAAMLWTQIQRRLACTTPYGAHPALEHSLFV